MVLVDNLPVKRDTFVLRQSPWNGIHIEQDLNGVARAGFASLDVDYRSSRSLPCNQIGFTSEGCCLSLQLKSILVLSENRILLGLQIASVFIECSRVS